MLDNASTAPSRSRGANTQGPRRGRPRPSTDLLARLGAALPEVRLPATGDALYGRTSSDEQAEKRTITNQQDYLHDRAELDRHRTEPDRWIVAAEYWDDGVSGTIPLGDRPEGRRLLDDAKAGRLRRVIVYNLTRLGRTLRVILDAYDELAAYGVAIVSATEPIDTSTPMGKFIFQLLGSLAELDRETTLEKLTMGRDRVAGEGRWTGGPIPFGLDVHPEDAGKDVAPRLVPSPRTVPQLSEGEADVAAGLFRAIDGGEAPVAVVRRLNALGVNSYTRYAGQAAPKRHTLWTVARLHKLLRNPIYKGEHTLWSGGPRSKASAASGAQRVAVERTFPALVDEALWDRVQARLSSRAPRTDGERGADAPLLRGLVVCGDPACGLRFCATTCRPRRTGRVYRYYRCGGQLSVAHANPADRCGAKLLDADDLEADAWAAARRIVLHDQETVEALRRQVRERQGQSAAQQARRCALDTRLRELAGERTRVMELYRRQGGRTPGMLETVEGQLLDISTQEEEVRGQLARLRTQDEMTRLAEARLGSVGALLARLRQNVAWIDAHPDDPEARLKKRGVLEALVVTMEVTTTGTGRAKRATVVLQSAVAEDQVALEAAGLSPKGAYAVSSPRRTPGTADCIQSPFVLTVPLRPAS